LNHAATVDSSDCINEEVLAGVLLHLVQPLRKEPGGDVLDRVEAEAVHARLVEIPLPPARHLGPNLLVLEVEVRTHQEGVVAPLQGHLVVEGLALAAASSRAFDAASFQSVPSGALYQWKNCIITPFRLAMLSPPPP
jgi:hypothetical protein